MLKWLQNRGYTTNYIVLWVYTNIQKLLLYGNLYKQLFHSQKSLTARDLGCGKCAQ